jgi:hypothetical protein
MVVIWLMMVNDILVVVHSVFIVINLSGWWCNNHLDKYEFVNGQDYPVYYGNKK